MKRIVFSKQADHDQEMFDFWYFWYTEVFKADQIVLTPVKTRVSSIYETLDFYASCPNVVVHPIYMDTWNPPDIWKKQLAITGRYVPSQDFLTVSADADEYYEFTPPLPTNASSITFNQVFIVADEPPSIQEIEEIDMFCFEEGCDAGFVGTLDSNEVMIMGHAAHQAPKTSARKKFHYALHGFDHFLKKVQCVLMDKQLSQDISSHWRNWRTILETEGSDALREHYSELLKKMVALNQKEPSLTERFRSTVVWHRGILQ